MIWKANWMYWTASKNIKWCLKQYNLSSLAKDKTLSFAWVQVYWRWLMWKDLQTSHKSFVSIKLIRLFILALCGSGWFLSRDAFAVQLKSPPKNIYSSTLHLLITVFRIFKNITLSMPKLGAYTLIKDIFTFSKVACIFNSRPSTISSVTHEIGEKSLEKRMPTPPLLLLLWLRNTSPSHSFFQSVSFQLCYVFLVRK